MICPTCKESKKKYKYKSKVSINKEIITNIDS